MPRRIRMILICGIICFICVAVMIFVLIQGPRQEIRFTPPPFEETAVAGVPPLTDADGYKPVDAQVYKFALCGELMLENGKTDIWLTNDAENEVWLKAVLKDAEGAELGETGLIRPGEYVQSIRLATELEQTTDVMIVVMGYEPETYYSMGNVTLYTMLTKPEE